MTEIPFLADLGWLRLDLLGRLLLAAALGGVVGLEREWSGKPAGFRTNLLICVGAALLTELSLSVAASGVGTVADPARIAAQIVSGIGFLGAGTIIQSRAGVVGLTTAATLWVVAAIGMAVGAQAYVPAVGATLLVVLALLALGHLEGRIVRDLESTITVTMSPDPDGARRVESVLGESLEPRMVEFSRRENELVAVYRVRGRRRHWAGLLARVLEVEGVRDVRER